MFFFIGFLNSIPELWEWFVLRAFTGCSLGVFRESFWYINLWMDWKQSTFGTYGLDWGELAQGRRKQCEKSVSINDWRFVQSNQEEFSVPSEAITFIRTVGQQLLTLRIETLTQWLVVLFVNKNKTQNRNKTFSSTSRSFPLEAAYMSVLQDDHVSWTDFPFPLWRE